MKNTLKHILIAAGIASVVLPSIAFAVTHTLQFVQTPTTTLYNSVSAVATTMRITPYPKDLDGTKLTMTDFGSSPTVTIDPKVKNYEEIVGFTGITDNGDNTATLTGLSRSLVSKYPYTTTGTGRAHTAGSIVVFSNNPQMYARLASWENDGTITGTWAFTTSPTIPAPTLATNPVTKAYADALAIQGAATSTEANLGLVQLATMAQVGSSTASSTFGGPLVTPNVYATTTPGSQCTSNIFRCIVATNFGKIAQAFWDLTASTTWTGHTIFTATTSIKASSVATSPFILNGVPYAFPSLQGGTGALLSNNGSGTLSWGGAPQYSLSYLTVTANNTTATSTSVISIPAGVMTASSTIQFTAAYNSSSGTGGSGFLYIGDTGGTVFLSCAFNNGASSGISYKTDGTIINNGSLTAQKAVATYVEVVAANNIDTSVCTGSSSFNMANALNLKAWVFSPVAANFTLTNLMVTVRP